jgi:hypothetical protein
MHFQRFDRTYNPIGFRPLLDYVLLPTKKQQGHVHCKDRCDLSLFQIGVQAIEYALYKGYCVPVGFCLRVGRSYSARH